jgi:hypothetical protein
MIGYQFPGEDWTLCQNDWGPTTGKHLNHIDPDKSKRLDQETFIKNYYLKEGSYRKDLILDKLGLPEQLWDNRKFR